MPSQHCELIYCKVNSEGSITELSTHRNICGLDLCGCSGHATGTSIDSYLDKTYIVRGLHGAKALNGYHDVQADIKVPRLKCLGTHTSDAVLELMSKVFVVSVPAFMMHGHLYIVLRTCTASLIMYHQMVTQELGGSNAVATKLRNSARSAAIADSCFPNMSPESLLDEWFDIIMNNYLDWNPEIAQATPDMVQIATVLNQHTEIMIQLKTMLTDLRREREIDRLHIQTQQETISVLQNTVSSLQDDFIGAHSNLTRANSKLAFLKKPPGVTSSTPAKRGVRV
jgi:hypothetical protein